MKPSMAVGGKASNLAILNTIQGISVPSFTVMPGSLSLSECESIVESFLRNHSNIREVAVRSSALNEDSAQASFAGMYSTKLSVPAKTPTILAAIEKIRCEEVRKTNVAAHYAAQRGLQSSDCGMAVIVQEMVKAEFSGVIFSHSLHARDGYYLISTTQGLGEAVASGLVNGQLIRVARAIQPEHLREDWLSTLVRAMKLIEQRFDNQSLDVEFAFENKTLHVLQCRLLTTSPSVRIETNAEVPLLWQLDSIDRHIRKDHDGDVLGDMIDINPSELLGSNPSRLDISIFGHLFADRIVERVRRDMGYDPLDVGLMSMVGDKPYVSLKASAFSFRPRGIPKSVYEKMFTVYRDMLVSDPGLQSRVEFAVFAMRHGEKLNRIMEQAGMLENEKAATRTAFRNLDTSLVRASDDCKASLAEWIDRYKKKTDVTSTRPLQDMLEHVMSGTEWFVRVARLAFYWKNRFEELFPGNDLNELLVGHIQSVSGNLQTDMYLCGKGQLTQRELLVRYGHLRPGQFSLFGESYADDPEYYLFGRLENARDQRIEKRRHDHEGIAEFKNVVAFMQAREEAKFLFSRSLGIFIDALKVALDRSGIQYAEASRCDWQELEGMLISGRRSTKTHQAVLPMLLPEVIIPGQTDLKVIASGTAAPSYITRAIVKARICVLERPSVHEDVTGAIVLIPSADPGYDFLFNSGVAGIITKNGGPASHMCIRAIELQMPSCIGCGERVYSLLANVRAAVLDCQSGQIIVPE